MCDYFDERKKGAQTRCENIRPQGPFICAARSEVPGYGSVEGESPRALAITRVLPKKTLAIIHRQPLLPTGNIVIRKEDIVIPAIVRQLRPYILEVVVSHVLHAKDIDVGVMWDAFSDVGVEAEGEFFAFLWGFGQVDYLGAFGSRHCDRLE